MLKKRFLLQTYVLQCSCLILGEITKPISSATISIDDEVYQEVSPFIQLLDNLATTRVQKDRDLLKERIVGKLEEKFKQGIKEKRAVDERLRKEREIADERLKNEVDLENKKKIHAKLLRILGVHLRLEKLVDDLYPERRPSHVGAVEAYGQILTSNDRKFTNHSSIRIFRERVSKYGISVTDFVDAVRSIYGCMSDFKPQPPRFNDVAGIKQMYESFGMNADTVKVIVAQIILEPLPVSTTTGFKTS